MKRPATLGGFEPGGPGAGTPLPARGALRAWLSAARHRRWLYLGAGLLAAGAITVAALTPQTPAPVATESPIQTAVPATVHPAAPPVPSATPTPGCGYAEARQILAPTLEALAIRPSDPTPEPRPTLDPPSVPLMSGGFLDLPVPYDGSAAAFRRLVNRSSLGGLITSYFDHEYPLYPWSWHGFQFSGSETAGAPTGTSVLAYDGTRLPDDWYTGHAGFDLAPLPGRHDDTPILAAADGIVESAAISSDGNHVVQLRHTVPGLGEYLTIYMHLQDDPVFSAMRMRVGSAVARGEQIGTMGSTGKSTGVHLHFEVRYDANGDGSFDRQERVDPFGYLPLETPDPWARDASWLDEAGRAVSHTGIVSRYLWLHPLGTTVEIGSEPSSASSGQGGGDEGMQACVEAGTFPSGSTLTVAWAPDTAPAGDQQGTGNGCVVYAQDASGEAIERFDPALPVTIPYSDEDIQFVDPASLTIYLYDIAGGVWEALPTRLDPERHLAMASFPRPGRCALRGRPTADRLPPHSTITLQGTPDENGMYCEPVTVSIDAVDEGDSGVAATRYSLDFGATWLDYVAPFAVEYRAESPVTSDETSVTEDSVLQDRGEQVVLAQAEDAAGNREYPPAISRVYMACPTAIIFGAEPAQITPPCCTTLTWDVANAAEVYLDGAAVETSGSQEVCPAASQTYTLRTVSSLSEETVTEATVEVLPTKVEFYANTASLVCGQSTTLTWNVANAREVYLDDAPVAASGSLAVCLKESRTYTLRVVPPCGDAIVRRLTINAAPLSLAFSANPTQVFPTCQCSVLRWQVPAADAVFLSGERVDLRGTRQVCPTVTTPYVLRAESGCCAPAESRVTVQTLGEPPVTFTADRTTIKVGERITLQWGVDNIQAVYLDGEGVAGHDARVVAPTADHTYTLRVVWACGEIVRTIPVTVQADRDPPVIRVTTGSGFLCGRPIRLEAAVYDASPLASVLVTYRYTGSRVFEGPFRMLGSAPNYYYEIEGKPGVTYAIRATDTSGNVATTDAQTTTCAYVLY